MSVPFRERNRVVMGAVSLAVIALLLLGAFRAQDLPLIGGGDTYYAEFSESGGLRVDDEVRIAGVRVGKVESIELDGDKVRVGFRVETDSAFGTDTQAAIKVKTLLGAMYIALVPAGEGQLEEDDTIPVERTSSPFDVVDAFEGLAENSAEVDTDELFRALVSRREAIHDLLVSTTTLSEELTALVSQSRADLKPALDHLENVVAVLNKNEDNIDNSIR